MVKLIGVSWGCSGEHLVQQALIEGRCMFMEEKGGRPKVMLVEVLNCFLLQREDERNSF